MTVSASKSDRTTAAERDPFRLDRYRLLPGAKGATAAQTILTANQNLTAIYSACGPPALGAIQSIKNAGIKPGGIILVGFDALPDEVAQIKAGKETGSVAQFPAKIGSLGVATLYKAVLGKTVPKKVDTGTAFVTKANASKFG